MSISPSRKLAAYQKAAWDQSASMVRSRAWKAWFPGTRKPLAVSSTRMPNFRSTSRVMST